jgi:hypothetical protein
MSLVRWGKPWGSMSPEPPPMRKVATVTVSERNELVRLANLAWAPKKPFPPPHIVTDTLTDVILIDGNVGKKLNGFGAGSDLHSELNKIALRHGF